MFGIKRPIKISNKEASTKVWQLANSDQTKKYVKIVSGEGFDDKNKGILRDKEFLNIVKKFAEDSKKIMIICWDKNGIEGLKEKFSSFYSYEEKEEIRKAFAKNSLIIFLARERPKNHFAVIDGEYLFIQKKHKKGTKPSKKPWLYSENDFFGEPMKHNGLFDSWAKECTLLTLDNLKEE